MALPSSASYPLRTFAFGSLADEPWGAAWFPRPGAPGLLIIATNGEAHGLLAELDEQDDGWRIRAQDTDLLVAPVGQAAPLPASERGPTGFEQLISVSGTVSLAGRSVALQGSGCRGEHADTDDLEGYDSVREVSAWFEPAEAVALIALRPRKQRGHEHDLLAAAVIDPEEAPVIAEPRLSTTYDAAGRPARVNLELWTDDVEQFPRRLAGEATQRRAQASGAGWELTAELLRCHSRGRDGAGVYLLARPA